MKKKIILIISVFTLLAAAGGAALLYSIGHVSADLDDMIVLHQVEIQREHLLLNVLQVQKSLYARSTSSPGSAESVMARVNRMETAIAACFDCHHTAADTERLSDLRRQIGQFGAQLKTALAAGTDASRFRNEREKASIIGDSLISTISTMIILTSQRLMERTERSRLEKRRSEIIVIMLIVAGPLMVALFGFTTLRSFAAPIRTLLAATRRMKAGNLDIQVPGLRDEFSDLAAEFNGMAVALRERLKEVTENERRYRLLFESAADAIFILDAEGADAGRIVSANRFAAALHGYTVEELTQMNIRDIDAPDAAQMMHTRIDQVRKGEWIKAEIDHVKRDGTVFPVEISAGMFEFDGHKYVLAIDRDLTERKRAEEMLQRAEHLRTTGELAAGLAHEIKNPLAGIKITMQTLAEESSLSPEDRSILYKVVDEIQRIDGLIKGLLNFARPPKPHFMATDVNVVLDGAAQLVMQQRPREGDASRAIEVVKDLAPDLPEVVADPMQLRQVFMNILMNAVDAMPGGGSLVLTTSARRVQDAITVSIADSGKGMDAAARERIFQPFFTTKAGGTGLGLAISKRLVEEQGGRISIDSAPGAGTTFTVILPVGRGKEPAGGEG